MNRELGELVAVATAEGWRVTRRGSGHFMFFPADPAAPLVTASATPSDGRATKNLKARLRRSGLPV